MPLANARLLLDTGSGFSEKGNLVVEIVRKEERITFIPGKEGQLIRSLCLRPAEDYLVLDLMKIEIQNPGGHVFEVGNFSSNAMFRQDRRLIFATDSPEIYVHVFNAPIESVTFWTRFEAVGKETIPYLWKACQETQTDYREKVLEYIGKIDRGAEKGEALEKTVQGIKAELEKLGRETIFLKETLEAERRIRESLLESSSWKLTAPVRKFSKGARVHSSRWKTAVFRVRGEYPLIRQSGLFDEADYLNRNPDVKAMRIDPITHYLTSGAAEGRDPHPLFDMAYYKSQNPGAAESGVNPLVHFLRAGAAEGLNPHPLFSTNYYAMRNPEVSQSGMNPLRHYMEKGAEQGFDPHPLFDTAYYKSQNPGAAESGVNPLVHFLRAGAAEGLNPHPLFSTNYYAMRNPEVSQSGMNPLRHYMEKGAEQGFDPHPLFDTAYYKSQNPEAAESDVNPLAHYLETGWKNGCTPHLLFDPVYYLKYCRQARETQTNPLIHYLTRGAREGFNPHPLFDTYYYWRSNPDVHAAGINALEHYVQSGSKEGRDPNPLFTYSFYTAQHPDAKRWDRTLLEHYLIRGVRTKKATSPLFDGGYYLGKYSDVARSGVDPLGHYLEFGIFEEREPNLFLEALNKKPKISILVPVYNTGEKHLEEMILSVRRQIYKNWELCLVDDGSETKHVREILKKCAMHSEKIKTRLLDGNRGISQATNEAAAMATGEYLALLDHDDLLTMDALIEVVKAINEKDPDVIYSDEALIDEAGRAHDSIFKPDFSPDLLLSHNYITHFLVFKRTLFDAIGGFDPGCDGAQDYDLILKLSEKTPKIHHIPKVTYFWRKSASSTSFNPANKSYAHESGKRALEAALGRRSIPGSVEKANMPFFYRVKRKISGNPKVSIVVPFKDQPVFLKKCVEAILSKSTWTHFEILGIDNGSRMPETLGLMKQLEGADSRVRFFEYPVPFNYSKINNYGVSLASGEMLLLLNNDVEILSCDWIEALLEHAQREEVGAVGGKLYYPNRTIQHAGVIVGIAGFAGHSHRHAPGDDKGYGNRLMCIQNVSAVSGAMMMVKRKAFLETGGLDEDNLAVSLNDIDFCLRLRQKDLFNIFTPYCEAVHHESASRGYEETPEQKFRFQKEIRHFQRQWNKVLAQGDPCYNPNLTLEHEDFSLKVNRVP